MRSVGLIGYGAIGKAVAEGILSGKAGRASLAAVLVRNKRDQKPAELPDSCYFGTDPAAFFKNDFNLCIEAAGQPAVHAYGREVLSSGRDIMLTSIGALADDTLYADLETKATENDSQLMLCTGALPGVDWLNAASLAELETVVVEQIKPAHAWAGTPAEQAFDLSSLTEATVIHEGPVRAATTKFPKNANVAAMFALATAGLDNTTVRLVADPTITRNMVRLELHGAAGRLKIEVESFPSPSNPKTSYVVSLAVLKAIRNLSSPTFIGI